MNMMDLASQHGTVRHVAVDVYRVDVSPCHVVFFNTKKKDVLLRWQRKLNGQPVWHTEHCETMGHALGKAKYRRLTMSHGERTATVTVTYDHKLRRTVRVEIDGNDVISSNQTLTALGMDAIEHGEPAGLLDWVEEHAGSLIMV